MAKDELDLLLKHKDLKKVPMLFFANKMDLPSALTPVECAQALKLDEIKDKPWQVSQSTIDMYALLCYFRVFVRSSCWFPSRFTLALRGEKNTHVARDFFCY